MKPGYSIIEPKHKKYEIGTMFFEYDEEKDNKLKRIFFVIDNEKFYMTTALTHGRKDASAWLFVKDGTYHAPNAKDLDHILALTDDVLQTYQFSNSLQNILEAIRPQSEIFVKLLDKKLTNKERNKLKTQLRQKNKLIEYHSGKATHLAKLKKQRFEQKLAEYLEKQAQTQTFEPKPQEPTL